jgi:triosephosphate isomerase
MRAKFVAGNWKMNTDLASGLALAKSLVGGIAADGAISAGLASGKLRTAVCPPFPYISAIAEAIKGSKVELGAQNCYTEKPGAFTGEVAAAMLKDIGCGLVILGHSERRHKMGETDSQIKAKLLVAQAAGLEVILCLGETLTERQAEKTFAVLAGQIVGALGGLPVEALDKLVIAYEPVWAIGTGVNATPGQAQEAHAFIRSELAKHFGKAAADKMIIQYGGSLTAENAKEILSQPDVDGGLVGGASLDAKKFLPILQAAVA